MPKTIEISHRTVIFTVLLLISLWFLYQITDIILTIFVSVIIMSALNPFIDWLERKRLPRGLAIVLVYFVLWGVIGSLIALIIPALADQSGRLLRLIPASLSQLDFFNTHQQEITREILSQLGGLPGNVIKFAVGLFSNFLGVVTTLFISFYLILERKRLDRYLTFLLGHTKPDQAKRVINEIERRLGGWVRGELLLMLAVGVTTYIGLVVLGVDIPVPLAVIAGLLEIIPNIGPTISAVPAIMVALTINPLTALATLALYILVQQAENNLLVPKIMEKTTGVNPLVSILALMIGFKIAGATGAVLSIPIVLVIQIIATEVYSSHHFENLTQ